MERGRSNAETCRLNDWGQDTVLVGTLGTSTTKIVITAIGQREILARALIKHEPDRSGGSDCLDNESIWSLELLDWAEVNP